jgi:hypothetical protein
LIEINQGDSNITNIVLSGDGASDFNVSLSGVITTSATSDLDYETKSFYELKAIATNQAGDSEASDVNITINNISDESNLIIQSAVYDTNLTISPSDDKLYIYFSKAVDETTFSNIISEDINISSPHNYVFGSEANYTYNNSHFFSYVVDMNNSAHSFVDGDHNISIINTGYGALKDSLGQYPTSFPKLTIESRSLVFNTKVSTSIDYDDGYYAKGIDVNFTRDDGTKEVTDNKLNLIWDDDSNVADDGEKKSYNDAITYCSDKGDGWRLPNKAELLSIVDRNSYDPALYSTFVNHQNDTYWSISIYQTQTDQAWYVKFGDGNDGHKDKDETKYVRCVKKK